MTNDKGEQFARFAGAVARDLYGEPNERLSSKDELRFGKGGSISVDLKTGRFYDHEQKLGGGVLWAVEQVTGKAVKGGEAVQWLRDNGYHVDDDRAPPPASAGANDRKPMRFDPAGNRIPDRVPDHGRLTATHDYRDENGALSYQVCRWEWEVDPSVNPKGHEKTFVQRRPDPTKKDGWTFSTKGLTQLPYRLPELMEDIRDGAEIFIVEGEKKADMLRELGVPATCNTGGAGKWPEALVDWFKGAKVTVIPDNDEAGQAHARLIASRMAGVVGRIRAVNLPGVPPKGSVDDWLPAGGSVEELYRLANSASRPIEIEAYQSRFGAVQWLDFDAPGISYEALIKGVLTKGEMSLLLGESQSGKSFLAIDIAMAVARGIDWFGRRVRRGGVIYQAGESATGVRRKRFPAYRKHYQVGHEPLPVVLLQEQLDLYSSDEHVEAFIEECKHWARTFDCPLELIVIDTFNKATPGANENDGKDMGVVLARCDRIRQATGAHVMLVHHLNAGGTKARGHTSLFANVENVILCRYVPDHSDADGRKIREAVIAKQKDGEDGVSFKFVLPQIEIGKDADGDRVTSCIVAPPSGQAGQALPNPGAIQLGGANQLALRTLYSVLEDEATGLFAPLEYKLPQGARVAERKVWSAKYYEASRPENFDDLSDDDKTKTRQNLRKGFERARDMLISKGIIGISDQHAWLTGKPVMGFGPPPGTRRPRRQSEPEQPPKPPADLPFADDDFDPRDL